MVVHVIADQPPEVLFVQCDDMVQDLAPATSYPSFSLKTAVTLPVIRRNSVPTRISDLALCVVSRFAALHARLLGVEGNLRIIACPDNPDFWDGSGVPEVSTIGATFGSRERPLTFQRGRGTSREAPLRGKPNRRFQSVRSTCGRQVVRSRFNASQGAPPGGAQRGAGGGTISPDLGLECIAARAQARSQNRGPGG